MQTLHPGDTTSKTARPMPASLFGYQPADGAGAGVFVDLAELEYRVLDAAGTEVIAWTSVDVDRSSPTTDALLDFPQGLYAPTFAVPVSTSYGTWTIQWRFRVTLSGAQLTSSTKFRVVDGNQPIVDGYAQVQDLINEGVPTLMFTAQRMALALTQASRLFEEWTGRFFEPRLMSVDLDGRGGPIHQLGVPIVGLSGIGFSFTTLSPADLPISTGSMRVYNRHIRNNLRRPDDRDDPRVEFLRVDDWGYYQRHFLGEADLLDHIAGFPRAQQNVNVSGVFGYTDWDGTAFGRTPELVKEAVLRIAMRKLQPLWLQTAGGTFSGTSGPVQSERTLDQSVTYANLANMNSSAFVGDFTGDPAIDQIILTYMRPPAFGSA